jgi:hypothetical protein
MAATMIHPSYGAWRKGVEGTDVAEESRVLRHAGRRSPQQQNAKLLTGGKGRAAKIREGTGAMIRWMDAVPVATR